MLVLVSRHQCDGRDCENDRTCRVHFPQSRDELRKIRLQFSNCEIMEVVRPGITH